MNCERIEDVAVQNEGTKCIHLIDGDFQRSNEHLLIPLTYPVYAVMVCFNQK